MSSYWASSKAKRRRVSKLVRDTDQDILSEYNLTAANFSFESINPPITTSSVCQLDGFPTTSDFSLNRPLVVSDQREDINLQTAKSSDLRFESEAGADEIEPENDTVSDGDEPHEQLLITSLKYWATSYSVSLVALSSLLSILKVFHPTLPKDGRTLLGTQASVPTVKIEGGEYYHFGIVQGVISQLACLSLPATLTTLVLQFNIDGLPLFRSSKLQFWPILGYLKCDYTKSPFVIGIFCGVSKPKSVSEYLEQFVGDLKNVLSNGIIYLKKQFKVLVSSFICDAPARAFIKQTKALNGYSGCDKCFQEGVWRKKMTYPETKVRLRTDSSFTDGVDEEHHIGNSPLSGVVKMVSMFPIDYMHLCCLGVTRKLLNMWLKGKDLSTKLPSQTVQIISGRLLKLRSYMPCEFNRKPRELTEMDRWKATEFRSFMLYWGPVVLKDCLPSEMYDNFMLFSVAMYQLLFPGISDEMLAFAHKLTVSFEHFGQLYGKDEIVYNVHQVIHLAEEYRQFGTLDNISGFPFENCLGQIKRLLRKPHQPLQQIVKRLSEIPHVGAPHPTNDPILQNVHTDGPVPPQFTSSQQYKKVSTNLITLSTKMGDNCIEVGDGFALVENIVQTDEDVYIIYRRFRHKRPYYTYPCDSSYIGTYKPQSPSPFKMDGEVVLWSVVQFPNGGTAVVLESWFKAKEKTLLWPPKKINLTKALRERMQPDEKWTYYNDVRLLVTCETFEEARRRETKYNSTMCATTEIESEDEGELREKRKQRPNPQYMHSDSDESSGDTKRKWLARPPDVGVSGSLGVFSYLDDVMPCDQNNNVTTPRSIPAQYRQLRPSQLARNDLFAGTYDIQQSAHEQVHNAGRLGSGAAQYHQLQVPQTASTGISAPPYTSGQNAPLCAPQHAQNDFRVNQYDPMLAAPAQGDNDVTSQMQGDSRQILKDIAIGKMTAMLAEVLVVVKEVSRDVHFIKSELADAKMTPAGCQGPVPATTQEMCPIHLPIANGDDFNEAESLLKNESVRQKMIARLALVGGTSSTHMIRRMLTTVMTNSLACEFNWAGKNDQRYDAKKPFKETVLQDCMFVAARQCDRKLTHQAFSDTVKKWLRYAPWRAGGNKGN